ncbi:Protein of unknown function DUF597 [Cynara cardunculus var. scolymus]|uniref:B box-type domain-containing protein n=1 Tax=Cynara cardunculus var. scolymus TaxID=59895 RepID=A0A103YAB8_CYNCS|nr:Protein of unknown function DUF597 [Cynara cardunculus var. scolymus]
MGDPSTSSSTIARHRPPSLKRSEVPPWVFIMINIAYEECTIHSNAKDNNKFDRFCIDCLGSFCSKCSSNHHGHNYIKGYISNSNKVLFLKKRKPQQQRLAEQQNSRDHRCIVCKLSLTDSSYCSIQCKVSAMSPELATVDNNEKWCS